MCSLQRPQMTYRQAWIRLALPKEASEVAFGELGWKIEQLIEPGLERNQLERIAVWDGGAEALRNMFAVLPDEAARRYGWPDIRDGVMAACTNP